MCRLNKIIECIRKVAQHFWTSPIKFRAALNQLMSPNKMHECFVLHKAVKAEKKEDVGIQKEKNGNNFFLTSALETAEQCYKLQDTESRFAELQGCSRQTPEKTGQGFGLLATVCKREHRSASWNT